MIKSTKLQHLIARRAVVLARLFLPTVLAAELIGIAGINTAISAPIPPEKTPVLIATAYTDITLPTLHKGDQGNSVRLLQQILSDDGFLHAAGIRLGNPQGAVVDGIFGSITESAVRELQQRYQQRASLRVTGQVNPQTWEVIDMHENPYRSPLPWK